MTPTGPCYWVAEDLCSRCAHSSLALLPDDVAALHALPPLMLGVSGYEPVYELPAEAAFAVLAQLQLASRHPQNVGPSRELARVFADLLQHYLGVTENLAAVCEAGWDQTQDVPAVPERRIIVP